jgi:CDP-glucose 4,6-dehydratase
VEALGVIQAEFWRGRRVLLTGHTGFKGAWLALWLGQMGAEVTGLALQPPSSPSLHALACDGLLEHDIIGDLRDPARVDAAFTIAKPEVVFHLAAQALVRPSFEDPIATYATNVMGTAHVLDAARRQGGVAALLVVTSDKAYENREWHWAYREDEAMGGHDPYSSSKGCAELVTAAFRRSYFAADPQGTAVATARAGNVIGGGDWAAGRVVPDCIRAFLAGQKVSLRSPAATRPWQHVLEPLAGYIALAEQLAIGGDRARFAAAWNFGPTEADAVPVGELVATLAQLWGGDADWELDECPQPHEAHFLKVDASNARALLGWRPVLGLSDALEWTVDWYRRQARGDDARALCLGQIARYRARQAALASPAHA